MLPYLSFIYANFTELLLCPSYNCKRYTESMEWLFPNQAANTWLVLQDLQLCSPVSQTWSREVLQLCCQQDFAHIHNTHSPFPPGLSDCFYAPPVTWKTASPCKHSDVLPKQWGKHLEGKHLAGLRILSHAWHMDALAQQHRFHLMQEALVKIILWFEKQCRQILGNTNLICDTEKPKKLLTKQPCPCTARHWQAASTTSFFTAGTGHLSRRSCRCNKTHPSFKRLTTVIVSWLRTQAGKLMN